MNRIAVLLADDTRISVLRWVLRFLLIAGMSAVLPAQSLVLESAGTQAGSGILLNLTLSTAPGNVRPAALEFAFSYPGGAIASFSVSGGPALLAPQKSLFCNGNAVNYICLAVGLNSNPISDGVIATIVLTPASGVNAASLTVGNPSAADSAGNALAVTVSSDASIACFALSASGALSTSETCAVTSTTPANAAQTQIGIFRPPSPVGAALGYFTLDSNGNYAYDATDQVRQFGLAGDYPVAGDWDGTGVIRLGVFRCPAPGTGICTWYLDQNNNGVWDGTSGGDVAFQFGLPGDIPVVGDWTGNGVSKAGVMRCPAAGQAGVCAWVLDAQNLRAPIGNFLMSSYGLAGDLPAIGNWAGAGGSRPVDNIGVFRSGTWILNSSGSGFWAPTDAQYSYGLPGDLPVTGNWLGSAGKQIGVFRCPAGVPGTAVCQWILNTTGSGSFSGTDLITSYGLIGDKPVAGFWTVQ